MERDAPLDCNHPMHAAESAADNVVVEPRPFISPRDFYREAVQRKDIRRILAALAKQP